MSAPKFTPGPWYVNGTVISKTPTGKRHLIAEVFRESVEQCKANAHLIAAAPKLYRIADWIVEYIAQAS